MDGPSLQEPDSSADDNATAATAADPPQQQQQQSEAAAAAAAAAASTTEEEPPTKKNKKEEDRADVDDDEKDKNEDAEDGTKKFYVRLNVYGEHKRAVSSVKFAPSRICKKNYNGNASSTNNNYASLVASASASAFIKVWDLKNEYFDDISIGASGTAESGGGGGGGNSDNNTTTSSLKSSSNKNDFKRKPLQHCSLCIGHSRGINEIAWNPVSPLIASASDDKTVRLWDAVTGDSLVEYKGHDNFVFCVDQHHALIASGSFDETVKLWDIRSGDCVSTLPAHSDPVTAVSFNRDGTCVASGSHDGLIRIWDVATGECLKTIFATGNPPVSSVKYSPNGKYLLAGTLDSCLRLWPVNQSRRTCSKTYSGNHVNTKYSIASCFDCYGNVVTGSENSSVVIYDVQTRKPVQILSRGHSDAVLSVSAHDKFPILASGGITNDRKVEFWVQQQQH